MYSVSSFLIPHLPCSHSLSGLPPPGSRCVQASVPRGLGEAPEPVPHGHDRSGHRQAPLLSLRGVQIPRGGVSLPQRGLCSHVVLGHYDLLTLKRKGILAKCMNVIPIFEDSPINICEQKRLSKSQKLENVTLKTVMLLYV